MSDDVRIERLEHRVRELQTAVVQILKHLGIEHEAAEAERARLDQIRLEGTDEAPTERLIELYS
jgi:hypothetical protein